MTEINYITDDDDGNCFELSYPYRVYIKILIDLCYIGGENIHISIMNTFK